jgi:hypothetical protein
MVFSTLASGRFDSILNISLSVRISSEIRDMIFMSEKSILPFHICIFE